MLTAALVAVAALPLVAAHGGLVAVDAATASGASITVRADGAPQRGPSSQLTEGLFQQFIGSNGAALDYHYFDHGDNGTVFYFDGDGTINFDYPLVPSTITWSSPEPGNGHVQRVNEEAAARGMDLVFLDHPENRQGGRSWWNGVDGDAAAVATQELIGESRASSVLLAGYSGGSEFFARHLLIGGSDWLPTNSAAVLMGGGGLAGFEPAPATERMAGMSIVWSVGERDVDGATSVPGWSALRVSVEAREIFEQHGYRNASVDVQPGVNHYNYDFRGIVGQHADRLLATAVGSEASIRLTSPVAPGRRGVSFAATGLLPGSSPTITVAVSDGRVLVAQPTDGTTVAHDGTYSGHVGFHGFRIEPRTVSLLEVSDGTRGSAVELHVGGSHRGGHAGHEGAQHDGR